MNTFQKYPKDWLILISVVVLGINVVLGGTFADAAKSPFWYHFWPVVQVVSVVALVGGWIYAFAKDRASK